MQKSWKARMNSSAKTADQNEPQDREGILRGLFLRDEPAPESALSDPVSCIMESMNEKEVANFIARVQGPVYTTDEEALDHLLWYGADVIWGEGKNMIKEGQFYLNGSPVDPKDLPEADVSRGYGRVCKGGIWK